jgi:Lrp/AsnC family leucine-responsive transcriptional regulator
VGQRSREFGAQLPRFDWSTHLAHLLGYSAAMTEPLDEIDRILARELVADGRATLAQLAATAGLSVSAVQSRVRRLEARGVVTGYSARINPEAVGLMLSAFVAISPIDPSQPDDAPARLEHIEAIESCHSVAGEESYVLLVRVESARALEDLLQQIRTAANVRTRSTIILQTFYAGRDNVP